MSIKFTCSVDPRIFIWATIAEWAEETEVPQKLKQFADIVYRF